MDKEQENQFKEHIKEMAREEIQRTFTDNLMETLNSVFIFKYVETLELKCKKQQEVIDKAIEFIKENKDKYYQDWGQDDSSVDTYLGEYEIKELLDILKEVSE